MTIFKIPKRVIALLERKITDQFDRIKVKFLGPRGVDRFTTVMHDKTLSLPGMYEAASREEGGLPNLETLATITDTSKNYLDALKLRTVNKIVRAVEEGANNPDSLEPVIEKVWSETTSDLKRIIETETQSTKNVALLDGISRTNSAFNVEDPNVAFIIVRDDKICDECLRLHVREDGVTPRVYKLSELNRGYHKVGMDVASIHGLHPNCFTSKHTNIFTEHAGYIPIHKIKIGDRVLTHTGKFQKVLGTLEDWVKPYNGKIYKISFDGVRSKANTYRTLPSLSVTPEHQFLTDKGWIAAQDLTVENNLMQLFTTCSSCSNEIPVRYGNKVKKIKNEQFCSKKCMANFQWRQPSHRATISKKSSNQMTKFFIDSPEKLLAIIKIAQNKTRELIKNEKFWAQQPKNKEKLAICRAKLNSINPRVSKEETAFINKLKEYYPELESQKLLYKWTVDGVLEKLKVIVEYDGGGHYLPVLTQKLSMDSFMKRQSGRDNYLQNCGYHILRYGPNYIIENVITDIERVSKNSTGKYFYKPLKINKIHIGKAASQKLYDLKVEADESFVANGVVSHNCRCQIVTLLPGYGFSGTGSIKYISKDHDEYDFQHKS